MGRTLLVLALAAAASLVPAAPARGPGAGAVEAAPIPLPPPGPMAERRDRWGGGPRGDRVVARQRSPSGRRIRVHFHGSGTARSRVLVVGCLNGWRCAGEHVSVRYECPPDDAELWWIPTLRPEGADLDRSARHPGAAVLRQAVGDLRPQITVLFRAGPSPVVRASGAGETVGRRYARMVDLPFSATPVSGLAAWTQQVRPGATAITVVLPSRRLEQLEAQRHGFAIQRLAGTRFVSPVHERPTPDGNLSVLTGRYWWRPSGADLGPGLVLANTPTRRRAGIRCSPVSIRRRLGRYGTLLIVRDRGSVRPGMAFPTRPRRLRLGAVRWAPCVGRAHVIRFSDAGRNIELVAAFGRDANHWTRRNARQVLETVRVMM